MYATDSAPISSRLIRRRSVTQIGLLIILVPIFFEMIFIVALCILLSSEEKTLASLKHAKEGIIALQKYELIVERTFCALAVTPEDYTGSEHTKIDEMFKLYKSWSPTGHLVNGFPELSDVYHQSARARDILKNLVIEVKRISDDSTLAQSEKQYRISLFVAQNYAQLFQVLADFAPTRDGLLKIESNVQAAEPEEREKFHFRLAALLIGGLIVSGALSLALVRIFTVDLLQGVKQLKKHAYLFGTTLIPFQGGNDEFAHTERILYDSNCMLLESRRKERAILDNAADVICSLDAKLRFESVNEASLKTWQYTPDEMLGRSLLSLLGKDAVNEVSTAFQTIIDSSGEARLEIAIRRKDSTFSTSIWTVSWSSESMKFFCVVHDVTELRALEKIKQRFLAMASHDLRTPLSSVGIALEMIASGKRGNSSTQIVGEVEQSLSEIRSLTELINSLLEMEKLESSKLVLDLSCASAQDICDLAKQEQKMLLQEKSIEIRGPSGDAAVIADEIRLIQAVSNVLSNAIKISPDRSIIDMSIASDDNVVEIRVAARQAVVSDAATVASFDHFGPSGLGAICADRNSAIGLTIAKIIVETHTGEIAIECKNNEGPTFCLKLPELADDPAEGAL